MVSTFQINDEESWCKEVLEAKIEYASLAQASIKQMFFRR